MTGGIRPETTALALLLTVTGGFIGWVGYRILFHRDVELIAGYRNDMTADTEALARSVGAAVLAIAGVTIIAGLSYPLINPSRAAKTVYWVGYTAITLLLTGVAVVSSRRHIELS